MTGRPSGFTQETADAICERLADGESLRSICRDDEMPATSTVCKWLGQFPEFAEQYARAREAQADSLFDDVLEIADNATPEEIHQARLRIDARKWMAGKLRPKKYGEKLELNGSGENGEIVHAVQWQVVDGRS